MRGRGWSANSRVTTKTVKRHMDHGSYEQTGYIDNGCPVQRVWPSHAAMEGTAPESRKKSQRYGQPS